MYMEHKVLIIHQDYMDKEPSSTMHNKDMVLMLYYH